MDKIFVGKILISFTKEQCHCLKNVHILLPTVSLPLAAVAQCTVVFPGWKIS